MKLGDIKISKSAILDASEDWCEKGKGSVEEYMQERAYLTIREAMEDFGKFKYSLVTETCCPTCGNEGYEESERLWSIELDDDSVLRLLDDLGADSLKTAVEALIEIDCNYLDLELPEDFTESWVYYEKTPSDLAMERLAAEDAADVAQAAVEEKPYAVSLSRRGEVRVATIYGVSNLTARVKAREMFPDYEVLSVVSESSLSETATLPGDQPSDLTTALEEAATIVVTDEEIGNG